MSPQTPPPLISEPKYPHLCLVTLNLFSVKLFILIVYLLGLSFLSLCAWSSQDVFYSRLLCVCVLPYIVWYCHNLYKEIMHSNYYL